jgi:hypothetical protein
VTLRPALNRLFLLFTLHTGSGSLELDSIPNDSLRHRRNELYHKNYRSTLITQHVSSTVHPPRARPHRHAYIAEAALSSDPNSPLFVADQRMASGPRYMEHGGDWEEAFKAGWKEWNGGVKTASPARRSGAVWEVLEKAKERKERREY